MSFDAREGGSFRIALTYDDPWPHRTIGRIGRMSVDEVLPRSAGACETEK
jgi:hypothetical protein